jgi:DNA-binding MarR family transcriptional regulator
MTSAEELNLVDNRIRQTQFTRLIAFADVVNRYSEIILKNKVSWLRTNALMFTITRGGSLTPSQLARIMLRSNYSVTKLIDGLEKDGLVKRKHNGKDRRSINVEVTAKGLKYVVSNLNNAAIGEEDLKSCMDEKELENLVVTVRKLRDKLIEKVSERYEITAEDRKAIFDKARKNA